MLTQEKNQKLKEFNNEREFREFLIDFLKKMGFTDVIHTHRYGNPEQGKDIIAKISHVIEGDDLYAFVVKYGRIGGGTNEIETIKNQIKQSFEYPYADIEGHEIKINKVKVVTNENFTNGAQDQISNSPELKTYNNYSFWWNENLVPLIDAHYPDFWLPGDAFAKEYCKNFAKVLNEEIEIRDIGLKRIDDRKIKKLLDIFIAPKLTISEISEDASKGKKIVKQRAIKIDSIDNINENLLLSGEQGSGKSKILNSIACHFAKPEKVTANKIIPVRLKAPSLRSSNFNLDEAIINEVKNLADGFYKDELLTEYKPLLFIDDIDLLKKNEKEELLKNLKTYCVEHNTHYVVTYRKVEFIYEEDIKTVRIHNFNIRQIEDFVLKYFDGTDRGQKFIEVLKQSNILSKLPTTPLTITLISLLYDENNFEIPATVTDIYSDFISILLGKLDIENRNDLLLFNIKRRIFTALALNMLDENKFTMTFEEFRVFVNQFLDSRGYQIQSDEELTTIIEKSGVLYKDDTEVVGFKQQTFIEFLASIEIYDHSREKFYPKLIQNFNDPIWQSTAIFYAGKSKELPGMIDDVINGAPNNDLKDYFINTGGMGYLAQALYLSVPQDRKKLVFKSLDNLISSIDPLKRLTSERGSFLTNIPLPFIYQILNFWFVENFKSITLTKTLEESFNDLYSQNGDYTIDFKLLIIASTLFHKNINEDKYLLKLLERKSFMENPILPLVAEMAIDISKTILNADMKIPQTLKKAIEKKKEYIKAVIKEPAYRFNESLALEEKNK